MKVLIACDKFKGSLNALDVCQSIARGINKTNTNINCDILPLADGGDGTLEVLQNQFSYKKKSVSTIDPLHRQIETYYLSNGKSAFIELAKASGIVHLKQHELDILSTTTVGTGQLIKDAIDNGHEEIILSVGGSCSNDLGFGIAYALGYSFINEKGEKLIPNGKNLEFISQIIKADNSYDIPITILADVDNPLYGQNGAANIYGPQKGADEETITKLNSSMEKVRSLILKQFDKDIDSFKGAGAAGGVPAGLYGLFPNVNIQNGFEFICQITNLNEKTKQADLVITGEGQFDSQSLQGKVVGQIIRLCQQHNTPVVVVSGQENITVEEIVKLNLLATYQVINYAKNVSDSIANCERYLVEIGEVIGNDELF